MGLIIQLCKACGLRTYTEDSFSDQCVYCNKPLEHKDVNHHNFTDEGDHVLD